MCWLSQLERENCTQVHKNGNRPKDDSVGSGITDGKNNGNKEYYVIEGD